MNEQIKEVTNYKHTDELTKETLGDKYEAYKDYINKLIERIKNDVEATNKLRDMRKNNE